MKFLTLSLVAIALCGCGKRAEALGLYTEQHPQAVGLEKARTHAAPQGQKGLERAQQRGSKAVGTEY